MADEKKSTATVEPAEKPKVVKQKATPIAGGKLAVILVRGLMGTRGDTRDTLFMLRLRKKHACVILDDNTINRGMLAKAKNYVAFGPIKQESIDALAKARKPVDTKKPVYHLAPPKGGFERGGIKKTFVQGGVLGFRKEMDTLIKKMM